MDACDPDLASEVVRQDMLPSAKHDPLIEPAGEGNTISTTVLEERERLYDEDLPPLEYPIGTGLPPGATVATEGYAGAPEMNCLNPKASQSPFELALAVWVNRIGLSSPVNFQFLLRHRHSIASWRCMSTTLPDFRTRSVPRHCFAHTFGNISVNYIHADWQDRICIHTGR